MAGFPADNPKQAMRVTRTQTRSLSPLQKLSKSPLLDMASGKLLLRHRANLEGVLEEASEVHVGAVVVDSLEVIKVC